MYGLMHGTFSMRVLLLAHTKVTNLTFRIEAQVDEMGLLVVPQ